MTTFKDLVAERGKLLSVCDLLVFMKDLDIIRLWDIARHIGYIERSHEIDSVLLRGEIPYPVNAEYGNICCEDICEFCDDLGLVSSSGTMKMIGETVSPLRLGSDDIASQLHVNMDKLKTLEDARIKTVSEFGTKHDEFITALTNIQSELDGLSSSLRENALDSNTVNIIAKRIKELDFDFKRIADASRRHTREMSISELLNGSDELQAELNEIEAQFNLLRKNIDLVAELHRQFRRVFAMDCAKRKVFLIEPDELDFWEKPLNGWDSVIATLDAPGNNIKLANSTVEAQIIEASRCLAMGRSTACVVHLHNVLELGIKWMRRKLPAKYLPGQKNNEIDDWISAINVYVQQSPSDAASWKLIGASCTSLRLAWRHPTVHADMIFTEESAKDAYTAIRSLMREVIKL